MLWKQRKESDYVCLLNRQEVDVGHNNLGKNSEQRDTHVGFNGSTSWR